MSLPDAPQSATGASDNRLAGQVFDPLNQPVADAQVVVQSISGQEVCRTHASPDGSFACPGLAPGEYAATVTAPGFVESIVQHVRVGDAAPASLRVTLRLLGGSTSVRVSATTQEIATAQIHVEEKQRILGIVPNFYTSFAKDAAPLTSSQKYSLAFRDLIDPVTFLSAGVSAGIEQANNSYKGYGQGAAGYGKRYGAAYGDGLSSDLFRHAIYASLFHQDPRYFYQGTGSFRSRFMHAISFAVLLRGDDGSLKPNYSYVAGYLTSGALSNAYYPSSDRGAGLVFTRAAVGVAGTAGEGLLREFIFNHFTTHADLKP